MKRALFAALAGLLFVHGSSIPLDAQAPPLHFFKSYFLTGDYAVAGVGLWGQGTDGAATGTITMQGVPEQVDVAAAFLYWQVVGTDRQPDAGAIGATFRGHRLDGAGGPFARRLGAGSPPCWSNGGATGPSSGNNITYTYRADVLRLLDVDPVSGKPIVNGGHPIGLPDSNRLSALGASLLVVYRDPSRPLSAIVIYDGGYTMGQADSRFSLTLRGFYDPAAVVGGARLTHIVGSGQANKTETLTYDGATLAVNPFGGSAGPRWDNPTFDGLTPPAGGEVTTEVTSGGSSSFDCLSFAATVFRTEVDDSDDDGLLDLWESSDAPLLDPYGRALPDLKAMGASPTQKDLFVEVGYMDAATPTRYGADEKPAHSHLPSERALKLVGDMFWNAPTGRIAVHFDVGDRYQQGEAAAYVVPAALARGGEVIEETATVCTRGPADPPWVCQFSAYPGTVGWKTGFRFLRDQVLAPQPLLPGGDDPCELPGNSCERRFDETRQAMFHYVLFAHALGLPRSELACLDAAGAPVADVGDACVVADNPDFRSPRTFTGIGDFPGGDAMVTLGAFADASGLPVGTPFMQASTLAHELGHNAERRHGGNALEPNCKPNYPSVMNYLYQLRGLLDDQGRPNIDFSSGTLTTPLDERAVADGQFFASSYRAGWYAPLATSVLNGRVAAARTHCDGSPLLPGEPAMVRVDARASAAPIDWNFDGDVADTTPALQDLNFNGRVNDGSPSSDIAGPTLMDADDWGQLRLDQIGSRRNVGGLYQLSDGQLAVGPLSLDVGKGDLGKGDLGKGDLGKGDLGKGDLGKGDLGKGDLGKGDLGKGDLGKGDLGGGDLFERDPNNFPGELDFETATDLARTPASEFRACVAGVGACDSPAAARHDVIATWATPVVGNVQRFTVYRVTGQALQVNQLWTPVVVVDAVPGQEVYEAVDSTELLDGERYTYFVVATYVDGVRSDVSDLQTITAINLPPVARGDAFTTTEDTPLIVSAPGVLANDGDDDSPVSLTAVLVQGPAHGAITLAANGAFTYTPAPNFSGVDGFTYRATTGTVSTPVAAVTLTVTEVNDAPLAFDIPDQTIAQDTATTVIPFTIVDEQPGTVTLTAGSSHPALVPVANIEFGGSDAHRTVRVTPAAGASGEAMITVVATDASGATAQDTFRLTVQPATATVLYRFVNLRNAPPPAGTTFRAGSSIPMQWQYARISTGAVVNSANAQFRVELTGPGGIVLVSNTDAGSSFFRYQASSSQWVFNLQTKLPDGRSLPTGTYQVTIEVTNDNGEYQTAGPFAVVLGK